MKEDKKLNYIFSKKSIGSNDSFLKSKKSKFNKKSFLFGEANKINNINSFSTKKNLSLKLPLVDNPINAIKAKYSFTLSSSQNKAATKKIKRYSSLFPTSINQTFYKNRSFNSLKDTITESNFESNKSNKITINNKFKEYQKLLEASSELISKKNINLSNEINNNPFMRKIEDLNKISHFEIIFHNSIMQNIKAVYEKTKKGFFKIEHITKSKNALGTGYICENHNNIFSVSDMIERMNPISTLKFSSLLQKDYKEFLGYEKEKKKNKKKEDRLRKKVIKKYHRELFFQNELADRYNIKKNSGIKFIIDEEDNKNKKQDNDIDNVYKKTYN
jgi:hypothetical protein